MGSKSGTTAAWLELVGKNKLQTFQDRFANAFNIALDIHDLNGQPLTVWAQRPLFCFAIRQEHEAQCDANFRSDLERVRGGETFIHLCPFGMIRLYVPILFRGKPVAYAVCSGMTYPDSNLPEALRKRFRVTVYSREEVQAIQQLLASAMTLLDFNLSVLPRLQHVEAAVTEDWKDTSQPPRESRISRRELEIVKLVCRGMSNKQIGAQLSISETTVKTHISNILAKLNLHDRTQIAMHFVQKDAKP
ncbi:MAG: HTH luxR-type domain-containing protein [Succiniclasticum sp.]|jgi:DNA-binding CsgD family transcriptional regulator